MIEGYTFKRFSSDLDNGYKLMFHYLDNKYMVYKVNENCYMRELLERNSKNPVSPKAMITYKAIKEMFPYYTDWEYRQEM